MFQKTSLITLTAAALFGGFGGLVLVNGPQDPASAAPRIGFVDISNVQNDCAKQKAIVAKLEKQFNGAIDQIKEREVALGKQAREELPLYEVGTEEHERLKMKLKVEEYEINLASKALRAKARVERYRLTEAFMDQIKKVIADYSKQNGFDAIFLHRPVQRIQGEETYRAAIGQWVLYRNEALDVTKDITSLMDKQ